MGRFCNERISAGFYLDYIRQLSEKINGPDTRNLSVFHSKKLKNNNPITNTKLKKLLMVCKNILSRGEPTLPSLRIERSLLSSITKTYIYEERQKAGSINFVYIPSKKEEKDAKRFELLKRAHYIIDPRLKDPHAVLNKTFDSEEEELFISDVIPNSLGEHAWQLFEPQRHISSMLDDSKEFFKQKVDFSYDSGDLKFITEIDGKQHEEEIQKRLDNKRSIALKKSGWQCSRIKAKEIRSNNTKLNNKIADLFEADTNFNICKKNFHEPLFDSNEGLDALKLVLSPFAIARIQWALIDSLESGTLSLDDDSWKIMVIERDVPCASLAVIDFLELLSNLLNLAGYRFQLPKIQLLVRNTSEFAKTDDGVKEEKLKNFGIELDKTIFSNEEDTENINLLIDISVLQRENFNAETLSWYKSQVKDKGNVYILRSVHSYRDVRNVYSDYPIEYKTENADGYLRYFLQNIFRKVDFREGQLDILKRSLSLKPVIALLPTGAGKSLCYQMSALLQPGITIVVDPLKTLMLDQAENLKAIGFDNINFVNSDQSAVERIIIIDEFSQGKYQLIFVSPERFQIEGFRKSVSKVTVKNFIPYLVIDEAHCVSEWGHDFRISYLNLSKRVKLLCSRDGFEPVVLALTGTASYSVLSDVQREIGVNDEEAKIQPSSFDRKELSFEIEKVSTYEKRDKLLEVLFSLPKKLKKDEKKFFKADGQDTNAGIVFVPYVNSEYGAYQLSGFLASELKKKGFDTEVGFFSGDTPKALKEKYNSHYEANIFYEKKKFETQIDFMKNKFPILVSTKSFGMGIDKPNIRYIIHYAMPQSLEAYYQEAGRAGRDKEDSICVLIFSDDSEDLLKKYFRSDIDADKLGQVKEPSWNERGDICRMMYFHRKSFKGINFEKKLVKKIFKEKIAPVLRRMKFGKNKSVIVDFSENRTQREKAMYRLSLIGLIEDYTIDYNAKQIKAILVKKSDEDYVKNIQEYIGRYKTEQYVKTVPQLIEKENDDTFLEKCISFLIRFVYDEIEKKRRRSLENIAEVSRNSKDGEEFREALLAYLEASPFTEILNEISKAIEPSLWWEAMNILLESDDVDLPRLLLGSTRRFLESSPDNPGLLILNGLGHLSSEKTDIESGIDSIREGLRNLEEAGLKKYQIYSVVEKLIEKIPEVLNKYHKEKKIFTTLGEAILDLYPTKAFAKELYPYCIEKSKTILLKQLLIDVENFREKFVGHKKGRGE